MRKLTREEFYNMSFREMAKHHGMEENSFIKQCFPDSKFIWHNNIWYALYEEWYDKSQNKLAKALR